MPLAFNCFYRWLLIVYGLSLFLLWSTAKASDNSGIIDLPSVAGLHVATQFTNIVLTWPSDSRESFAVLWRSNANYQAPWVVLANPLSAASGRQSAFIDVGGLARIQKGTAETNLSGQYAVYVIPDFWFNLENVTLNGNARNGGKDFLPFYDGSKETAFFKPEVELLVDGEDQHFGDEDTEIVNFDSPKGHDRFCASGFWFKHDLFANGKHTLQIRTQLTLNNFIGQQSQFLMLTNKAVQVWSENDISFVGFPPLIGKTNVTLVAQSRKPNVNWKIDVYDSSGHWLITKQGQTTNGDIRWTWDLRDAGGQLHHSDADFSFKPYITVWPLGEPANTHQLSTKQDTTHTWSDKIFGATQNTTPAKDHEPMFCRPLEFSNAWENQTSPWSPDP